LQPDGGVKKGQIFEAAVCSAHSTATEPDTTGKPRQRLSIKETRQPDTPERDGRWKDGILSCFRHGIFHPTLWNACCCPHVLMIQLWNRLKLEDERLDTPSTRKKRSYTQTTLLFLIAAMFDFWLFSPLFGLETSKEVPGESSALLIEFVYICWSLILSMYTLLIAVRLRVAIREKHQIPSRCCGKAEDLCCIACCHCCTLVQLAKQTTDYEEEEAACCTTTGLASQSKRLDVCMVI